MSLFTKGNSEGSVQKWHGCVGHFGHCFTVKIKAEGGCGAK